MPVLRNASLRLWRAAIFGATFLLVLTVGFVVASSALKLPAKASARAGAGEPAVAAAAGAGAAGPDAVHNDRVARCEPRRTRSAGGDPFAVKWVDLKDASA